MKQSIAIAALAMLISVPAFAGSSVGPITLGASVQSQLELSATIYEGDVSGGNVVTAMQFGQLAEAADHTLKGTKHFTVLLGANTSSRAYTIKQTGTALTAGANSLATGSLIVSTHGNGQTLPGTLANPQTWVGTDKVLYTSEAAGSAQAMAAVYAIGSDDRTEVIPADQTGAAYAGSVSFNVVLNA